MTTNNLDLIRRSVPAPDEENSTAPATEEAASEPEAAGAPAVNLPALARKVYALFKAELIIERERLGRSSDRWSQ